MSSRRLDCNSSFLRPHHQPANKEIDVGLSLLWNAACVVEQERVKGVLASKPLTPKIAAGISDLKTFVPRFTGPVGCSSCPSLFAEITELFFGRPNRLTQDSVGSNPHRS
ncbi:hypothetical protein VTH06DRAFT_3555 [Thermothelomyces fergusii]